MRASRRLPSSGSRTTKSARPHRIVTSDFALPVFVIQGTADDFTPAELSRAWLGSLTAPQKEFVPIDNAGHFALTSHGEEFLEALRGHVRPLAAPPNVNGAL